MLSSDEHKIGRSLPPNQSALSTIVESGRPPEQSQRIAVVAYKETESVNRSLLTRRGGLGLPGSDFSSRSISRKHQVSAWTPVSILSKVIPSRMRNSSARVLDQEPDTIAVFPNDPDYMVIGTYSLVSRDTENKDAVLDEAESSRIGSLQVLPVLRTTNSPSSTPLVISRLDFLFGIYDIHFHPDHSNLLGVATSNAEILFFRTSITHTTFDNPPEIKLINIGEVLIEDPYDNDKKIAIITQFQFVQLPDRRVPTSDFASLVITLLATTQFGNTKLVQILMSPFVEDGGESSVMTSQDVVIHKQSYDLEAWTVLPIFPTPSELYVLSGGDDSHLVVSRVDLTGAFIHEDYSDLALDLVTTTEQLIDRRTHEAGVVYICALGEKALHQQRPHSTDNPANDEPEYLVLTGSYDESLRLFLFSPSSPTKLKTQLSLLEEIKLGGGVWRILPLDTYVTPEGCDHILLVAAHTAGACIVRLSCKASGNGKETYRFTVEKWLKEGHESLVYAVTARKTNEIENTWDIVSASFYDKKLCTWQWTDEGRTEPMDSNT